MSILADIDSLSTTSSEELWAIVQTFDTEIARVEALLNGLALKRALLKKKINHHSSPLIRIPSDITSEIFKAYVNKERETEGGVPWLEEFDSRCALPSPLFLGSVCRTWRELAWSTPWMWSSVALEVKTPSQNSANFLAEWLSRSGQCALTISLRCDVDRHQKIEDTAQEVISVVVRFSERWRHITFDLPSPYYDNLHSIQGRLPLLESLSMRLLGGPRSEENPFWMFSIAPQLKMVQCSDFPPHSIVIPLAQLTSLSGYQCNIRGCLHVLDMASQLIYASFNVQTFRETPALMPRSSNPCLQSLEFSIDHDSSSTSTLLDNLTLPNLRKLWFETHGRITPFSEHTFASFIFRSDCPLRSLSLTGFPINDDCLLRCLQVLPTLEVLIICGSNDITDQTIRNLTPNMTSDLPLLSNLQELSISSVGLFVDDSELQSMLYARWRSGDAGSGLGVTQLQSVKISAGGTQRYGLISPRFSFVHDLMAEGMQISLTIF
jgi:hypothetical protein